MASSSRPKAHNSQSTRGAGVGSYSPLSGGSSRAAESVQVAPYLTHIIRHHGQVTLIPPENSGRIRKQKERKNLRQFDLRAVGVSGVTGLSSSGTSGATSGGNQRARDGGGDGSSRPASSLGTARAGFRSEGGGGGGSSSSRANEGRLGAQGRMDGLGSPIRDPRRTREHIEVTDVVPDFPPPSFEEAISTLSTPGLAGGDSGDRNGGRMMRPGNVRSDSSPACLEQPQTNGTRLDCDTPPRVESSSRNEGEIVSGERLRGVEREEADVRSLSSSRSSHSSVEYHGTPGHPGQFQWEEDRKAGLSLEERVRRELERRRLSESLPKAPPLRLGSDDTDVRIGASTSREVSTGDSGGSERKNNPEVTSGSSSRFLSESNLIQTEDVSEGEPSSVPSGLDPTGVDLSLFREIDNSEATSTTILVPPSSRKGKERAPPLDISSEETECLMNTSLSGDAPRISSIDVVESAVLPVDPDQSIEPSGESAASSSRGPFLPSKSSLEDGIGGKTSEPCGVGVENTLSSILSDNVLNTSNTSEFSCPPSSSSQVLSPTSLSPNTTYTPTTHTIYPPSLNRKTVRDRPLQTSPSPIPPLRSAQPAEPSSSTFQLSPLLSHGSTISPGPIRRKPPPPPPPPPRRKSAPGSDFFNISSPEQETPCWNTRLDDIITTRDNGEAFERRDEYEEVSDFSISPIDTSSMISIHTENVSNQGIGRIYCHDDSPSTLRNGNKILSSEPMINISSVRESGTPGSSQTLLNNINGTPQEGRGVEHGFTERTNDIPLQSNDQLNATAVNNSEVVVNSSREEPAEQGHDASSTVSDNLSGATPLPLALPLVPMFTGPTDLDLLLARLEDPDFTFGGRSYDDLLLLEEIFGPAIRSDMQGASNDPLDLPLGRVEVLRRRVTKDGRTKLKLALMGVVVDKCGICLSQFKEATSACLTPCQHAFHENCMKAWYTSFYPMNVKFALIDKTIGYNNVQPRSNTSRMRDDPSVPKEIAEKAERLEGAHLNGNEVLPLWIGAILAGHQAGIDNETLNIASLGFIITRMLYNYVYINQKTMGVSWIRTGIFFTSLSFPMYLFVKAGNILRKTGI
ncbi:zinc C3HC4 type (RING finger) [Pyrrhoderma noxium]|uniref:Zinc C3HC4 type (RING finger) n=1 Tax=Pyrrhoderma noxium TaxID=2282107 RepID=A0A286U6J0_9AGAM|nr:zinc C3HC4 type (RING finger) [Pyrrhoderma noxium]